MNWCIMIISDRVPLYERFSTGLYEKVVTGMAEVGLSM